jgi:subtilisin family serine protease
VRYRSTSEEIALEKVIVLRDLQIVEREGPFAAGVRGTPGPFSRHPEPAVDVLDADDSDLSELRTTLGVVGISSAVPTRLIHPISIENASSENSWGISAINAENSKFDGKGVTVAILDTGIDRQHPAFAGVSVLEEDFTATGNGDRNGHGTHCAGIVFGRDVQGHRIGVARGVERVRIAKILLDDGSGSSEMIFRAITWAADAGADVISMSVGLDFPGHVRSLISAGWPADLATSRALEAYRSNLRLFDSLMAMLRAQEEFRSGGIVVAAAGNESRRDLDIGYTIGSSLPAAASGVISVAAVERVVGGLAVASFSNTLPDVAAPGVGIVSARAGQGLCAMSGTSMACPHVAGAAALWWQALRNVGGSINTRIVKAKILASARTDGFARGGSNNDVGAGLVRVP